MYKRVIRLWVLFFVLVASSCSGSTEVFCTETFDGGGAGVSAVDDFAKGGDLSVLKKIEDSGGVYKQDNVPKDALLIFKEHGFNWIRLRLFHSPSGEGPVCNDLAYTTALAQRFKAQGFKFLLNFHYSDTWADPGHQDIPAAWESLSHAELVDAVFDYTRDCIIHLRDNGAMPDMVQIGNEVICGMLWPDGEICDSGVWSNFVDLVEAGIDGVEAGKGAEPMPLIMIHIDRGGNQPATEWFFDRLLAEGVGFDVIGQSYYPWWHGTLSDLTDNLEFMANEYGKDIYVVETGYNWTGGGGSGYSYPTTPEGQKGFLDELIERVRNTPNNRGKGVFYWSPDWIDGDVWGAPDWSVIWEERALFDFDGNMLPGMTAFLDVSAADFNGDRAVNFIDYSELTGAWGTSSGEPGFDDIYDLHDDDVINILDLGLFSDDWLWSGGA